MTQEEKDLLLKDLCARLPYGVKVLVDYIDESNVNDTLNCLHIIELKNYTGDDSLINIKPYLRPMSSITEEEKKEMHDLLSPTGTAIYTDKGIDIPLNHYGDHVEYEFMDRIIDYLNAHHLDHNNLISRELALEVKNDFYKIK